MEPVKIDIPLSQAALLERQEKIRQLKKDLRIQNFLSKNQLDEAFLEQNAGTLSRWLERINLCAGCSSKADCTQPIRGKVCNLSLDECGYLIETYTSCRYERAEQKKLMHTDKFLIKHGDTQDFFINLKEIDIKKESREYIEALLALQNSFEADKGVYLYGQPGVGKTYLMNGAANYFAKKNQSVSFVKMPALIANLKEAMTNSEYRMQVLKKLRFADVLFLDDIGSEAISKWTRSEILLPVLDERMSKHKKTYFTSNYTLQELQEQYCISGEENTRVGALRLMERIQALASPVELLGKSRR